MMTTFFTVTKISFIFIAFNTEIFLNKSNQTLIFLIENFFITHVLCYCFLLLLLKSSSLSDWVMHNRWNYLCHYANIFSPGITTQRHQTSDLFVTINSAFLLVKSGNLLKPTTNQFHLQGVPWSSGHIALHHATFNSSNREKGIFSWS